MFMEGLKTKILSVIALMLCLSVCRRDYVFDQNYDIVVRQHIEADLLRGSKKKAMVDGLLLSRR